MNLTVHVHGAKVIRTYKIIRTVYALFLSIGVLDDGRDMTRILFGFVLSDVQSDWLVYFDQEVH